MIKKTDEEIEEERIKQRIKWLNDCKEVGNRVEEILKNSKERRDIR